jgi:hypothetical protein
MKLFKFLIIFLSLFLSGCFLEKNIDSKTAQDYLNYNKLYLIDDYSNKYVVYEFEDSSLIINSYSDRDLTTLNDLKIYNIEYNDNQIKLKTENNIYKCDFFIESSKEYMGLNCNSIFDNETLFIGGWKSLHNAYFGE